MKITDVKSILCQGGIRNWVFARVHTDEGMVGIGDGTDWPEEYAIADGLQCSLTLLVFGTYPMDSRVPRT